MTFKAIDTQILIDQVQRVSKEVLGTELKISNFGRGFQGLLPITVGEGEAQPAFYLFNRNDGRTALKFNLGFRRIICNNGLIVPGLGISHRVIHREGPKANDFIASFETEVRSVLNTLLSDDFADFKASLESIVLNETEGVNLIGLLPMHNRAKSLSLRFWLNNASRRAEDQGYTAWQLYNLVNEFDRQCAGYEAALNREIGRVEDILLLTQNAWDNVA